MQPDMLLGQLILNVVLLARAVEGEGCLTMVEPMECATWLVHCALYRSTRPWWHDSIEVLVRSAFHGVARVQEPSQEALSLTIRALTEPKLIHGCAFMVSEADYQAHPEWSRTLIKKSFWNENETAGLHFLETWPGTK